MKVIFTVLISFSLLFADTMSIDDLAFIASKKINSTIVFSNDVKKDIKIVFAKNDKLDYFSLFRSVLKSHNMRLKSENGFISF